MPPRGLPLRSSDWQLEQTLHQSLLHPGLACGKPGVEERRCAAAGLAVNHRPTGASPVVTNTMGHSEVVVF
jgi:hypothetical protein